MKKTIIAASLVLTSLLSYSQTNTFFVEEQNYYNKSSVTPLAQIQGTHYGKDTKFGFWGFAMVTETWGELYAGPNYTVTLSSGRIVELGIAGGIEIDDDPIRGSAYIYSEKSPDSTSAKGKNVFYLTGEYGGSGYWYQGYFVYNVTRTVGLGVHAQYAGDIGPRLQWTKGHLQIWLSGGYNLEEKEPGGLSGLRITF